MLDFPVIHSRSDVGHFEPSVRLGRSAATFPILYGHLWNIGGHRGAVLAFLHLHRPGDHPRAGRTTSSAQKLPCPRCEMFLLHERVLVHRMLALWFGKTSDEDDFAYVERFNKLVREELLIVVLSDGTLRFSDAVKVAWSVTIPWISDFIPWWADSDLTGFLVED